MSGANPHRGEASLIIGGVPRILRPSFSALVAAEEELGPLLALVERAAAGQLRLAEIAALFWHCLPADADLARAEVNDAITALGLAHCAKPLRAVLSQILQGSAVAEGEGEAGA